MSTENVDKYPLARAQDSLMRAHDILSYMAGVAPHEALNDDHVHGQVLILESVLDEINAARKTIDNVRGIAPDAD